MPNTSNTEYARLIMAELDQGTLSKEETQQRLETMIDRELQTQDRPSDTGLITACYQLLARLQGLSLPLHSSKSVQQQIKQAHQRVHRHGWIIRAVAVSAAVILLSLTILLPDIQWFETSTSDDGEQFILEGRVLRIAPVTRSHAIDTPDGDFIRYDVHSMEEVADVLGFMPPVSYPQNWIPQSISVHVFSHSISIFLSFSVEGSTSIQMMAKIYTDKEDIYGAWQSDGNTTLHKREGVSYYWINNMGRHIAVWFGRGVLYSMYGLMQEEDCLSVIKMNR